MHLADISAWEGTLNTGAGTRQSSGADFGYADASCDGHDKESPQSRGKQKEAQSDLQGAEQGGFASACRADNHGPKADSHGVMQLDTLVDKVGGRLQTLFLEHVACCCLQLSMGLHAHTHWYVRSFGSQAMEAVEPQVLQRDAKLSSKWHVSVGQPCMALSICRTEAIIDFDLKQPGSCLQFGWSLA